MMCERCKERKTDSPYRLGSQQVCRECYEDQQRRMFRDAYDQCEEMAYKRLMDKDRTGALRRENRCNRNVNHHDS